MTGVVDPMTETSTTTKKKKGLFGKLKMGKKKAVSNSKESRYGEADTAEHDAAMAAKSVGRDGRPVITSYNAHQFHPSDVRDEDVLPTSSSSSPTGAPPTTPDRSVRSTRSSRSNGTNGSYTPDRSRSSRRGHRGTVVLDRAPTAKESAFSGPPRYDWVDVVSDVGGDWPHAWHTRWVKLLTHGSGWKSFFGSE